ncbi:hypothetical protein QN277_025283 [Acacia crassicarpa]|uniref:Glycosyl transferase 64 domain-containing protein n=1 Tax=Acacia crassicarpa TaxID=499986 RepID=A0AAE1JHY0_9FABA|nr:hypothetical protein QN277_025283 [Acacia crassicarpa]
MLVCKSPKTTNSEQNDVAYYRYGGWWSVWRMGTYSMVLSKAAFIHWKYLDLYAHMMPLQFKTILPGIETVKTLQCLVANAQVLLQFGLKVLLQFGCSYY